jgi:zinc protease
VSRVNLNLREAKGYTYGARTTFDYRRGAGPFTANAGVQTAVTKESVSEFLKELRGIRGDIPVTQKELDQAKESLIRGFPRTFETPAQIAARLTDVALYGLPDNYFNGYIAGIRGVTAADVARVANAAIDPAHLAILVVGDRSAIESGLRSLEGIGITLTVLDAEGHPVGEGAAQPPGH